MKKLLIIPALLVFRAPCSITVNSTVTVTSGAITCVFSAPNRPTVHAVCTLPSSTIHTSDVTPTVGSTNGDVGTVVSGGSSITWAITQPTAGILNWQITDGTNTQNGTL